MFSENTYLSYWGKWALDLQLILKWVRKQELINNGKECVTSANNQWIWENIQNFFKEFLQFFCKFEIISKYELKKCQYLEVIISSTGWCVVMGLDWTSDFDS